jgi:hypothetical protein
MYLGTIYIYTEFIPTQSDFKILENQQTAVTPELMAGSSPNFYYRYI